MGVELEDALHAGAERSTGSWQVAWCSSPWPSAWLAATPGVVCGTRIRAVAGQPASLDLP